MEDKLSWLASAEVLGPPSYREAEKTIGFWPLPAPKYNRGQKPKKHGRAKAKKQ